MGLKFCLVLALLGCTNAALPPPSSASPASPGQIAYAISQNYDQTGPGAHLPLVEQPSSTPSQSTTTQSQQSQAQALPQSQVFPQGQNYLQTPTYSQAPSYSQSQSFPQGQNYLQSFPQSQPQLVYSQQPNQYVQSPVYPQQQSPSYSQQQYFGQPLAYQQPLAYSQPPPSSFYSQAPQSQGGVQYVQVPRATAMVLAYTLQPGSRAGPQKLVQRPEVYDPSQQYSFNYEVRDASDPKAQQSQGQAYALVEQEGSPRPVDYSTFPQQTYNAALQRQPQAKQLYQQIPQGYVQVPQTYAVQPQILAGRSGPLKNVKVNGATTLAKPVYQTAPQQQNSLGSVPQQYSYSSQ